MSKSLKITTALIVAGCVATGASAAEKLGLGRPALPQEVAAWNTDISPSGAELPEGSGSVEDGEAVFADNCAVCHGDFAEGVDNWPKLAGGEGTLADKDPLKTVGSYWPYLSTAWDYVHRSMPFGNAQSMSPDDVYAIVAYILYSNDLVEEDFVLSKDNFLDVELPNADGFIVDDRPTTEYTQFTEANACMENCKETVEITMRAAVLDVTPDHGGDDDAAAEAEMSAEAAPAAAETTEEAAKTDAAPVEDKAAEEPKETAAEPAVAALDPEMVAEGEKVYKKCKACHQVGDGAKNKTGPELNGIVGRQIASVEGFKYSKVLAEMGTEGKVWDIEALSAFLAKPKAYAKGTKMSFAGLKKDDDITAIIEFLKSNP